MSLPPDPCYIAYTHYGAMVNVLVGYRTVAGTGDFHHIELSRSQASALAVNANRMVSCGEARVALFSSGWTIYPKGPLSSVETLWTP